DPGRWTSSRRPRTTSIDLEQIVQVFLRQALRPAGVFTEDGGDEILLLLFELEDLLFDRARGDQSVDGDDAVLPDAVRTIRRLIFDGRVPPRVEVNHGIGR